MRCRDEWLAGYNAQVAKRLMPKKSVARLTNRGIMN